MRASEDPPERPGLGHDATSDRFQSWRRTRAAYPSSRGGAHVALPTEGPRSIKGRQAAESRHGPLKPSSTGRCIHSGSWLGRALFVRPVLRAPSFGGFHDYRRRFERFAEVRQHLPDWTWLGDEGDEPDVAATRRALQGKLLPHPRHRLGPRNPGGVVRAGLCMGAAAIVSLWTSSPMNASDRFMGILSPCECLTAVTRQPREHLLREGHPIWMFIGGVR
jgi:hypothetical protein